MIKRLILWVFATGFSISAYAAHSPVGYWQVNNDAGKKESIVKITSNNNVLEGIVVEAFNSSGEASNPICSACKGDLKDKPIKGLTILSHLTFSKDQWVGGQVLAPKTGESYHCSLNMPNNDSLQIVVKKGVFSKTKTWTRVSP